MTRTFISLEINYTTGLLHLDKAMPCERDCMHEIDGFRSSHMLSISEVLRENWTRSVHAILFRGREQMMHVTLARREAQWSYLKAE